MSRQVVTIVACLAVLSTVLDRVQPASAQSAEDFINQLEWRNIGPANMGGRINDFAVVESDPNIVFASIHLHFASSGLRLEPNIL